MAPQRIGILGGTFDPIHMGHLVSAQMALEKMNLERVIFVPSNIPPHKKKAVAQPQDRFQMVRLAIKGNPYFDISSFELNRQGRSYTVDTLRYFKEKFPRNTKLFFIVGGDALSQLRTWKRIDDIHKMVSFIVVDRPQYLNPGKPESKSPGRQGTKEQYDFKYYPLVTPGIGVSSSMIRRRAALGQTVRYLVPQTVARYIENNKLYKSHVIPRFQNL